MKPNPNDHLKLKPKFRVTDQPLHATGKIHVGNFHFSIYHYAPLQFTIKKIKQNTHSVYHQHFPITKISAYSGERKMRSKARQAVVNTAVVGQAGPLQLPTVCAAVPPRQRLCSPFPAAELLHIPDEAAHIKMQNSEVDHVCCGDENTA